MLFHWGRVYGGAASEATALVDAVFDAAAGAAPRIFEADSRAEPARQAKFEHMCAFLAAAVAGKAGKERRAALETMVDRLEVGLREAGVSDVKVGTEVRTYAAAMNGRVLRYEPLILKEKWEDLAQALAAHGVEAKVAAKVRKCVAGGGKVR
ncbi:MAG: hypothetical protein GC129_02710 [Proteobacteria bacterium]|nr:hypothetical protein [Pseudomonadota bacterium]